MNRLVGNVVEQVKAVVNFLDEIKCACIKEGLPLPSDEKVAEYIEQGYLLNVEDFIADYKEKEGIFRCAYSPLEQKTLDATLKLSDEKLVKLWNTFIEESALYGEDSYIFDLEDTHDFVTLIENMDRLSFQKVSEFFNSESVRFIQWFNLNDGSISVKKNIKGIIKAFWGEIFERIMLYPSAYYFNVEVYCEGDGSTYFDDVFFPIIAEEVGYKIDGNKGTITKIEK